MSDLIVEETESRRSDGVGGIGVQVSTGAQFELTRGLVSTNREIGVFVSGEETVATLKNIRVTDTRVALCEEDPMMQCPFVGEGFGDGILVAGGSLLTLEDFAIESNIRVGLYLYDTQDSGLDTGIDSIVGAPILNAARGLVVSNAYGINFRQGTITPSDGWQRGGLLRQRRNRGWLLQRGRA